MERPDAPEPIEPIEPIEPTEPIEPIEPTEPTEPTEPPREGEEPPAERARRHGRRTRLYVWATIAVILVGLLIAWVVANRETVEVDWLVGSTDAALALVIFVAAALGWIVGIATSAAIRRRTRRP